MFANYIFQHSKSVCYLIKKSCFPQVSTGFELPASCKTVFPSTLAMSKPPIHIHTLLSCRRALIVRKYKEEEEMEEGEEREEKKIWKKFKIKKKHTTEKCPSDEKSQDLLSVLTGPHF